MDNYQQERRKLTSEIRKLVKPYFRPSGYFDGWEPDGKLRIATFKDNKEKKLRRGFVLQTVEGFTKVGAIVNSYAFAMTILTYQEMPIEDLYRLRNLLASGRLKWNDKHLTKQL